MYSSQYKISACCVNDKKCDLADGIQVVQTVNIEMSIEEIKGGARIKASEGKTITQNQKTADAKVD